MPSRRPSPKLRKKKKALRTTARKMPRATMLPLMMLMLRTCSSLSELQGRRS